MSPRGMPVAAGLEALIAVRPPTAIVVTNQGASRLWPHLARHPLDLHYNPSTMGGAVPLGLGLALAQPSRDVWIVSGEGSLLMSLGSLVTVVASGAANLTLIVLDNDMYEITGGQATPAGQAHVDWSRMALAAGFKTAAEFESLAAWQAGLTKMSESPGPRLLALRVGPAGAESLAKPTPPLSEQIDRLRSELGLEPLETDHR